MISEIEKAQIKSRLLSLDIKKLKEAAKTLKINVKPDWSLNEVSEYITEKVVAGEINKENLFNLVDYFGIAEKVEHKTLGLKKDSLGKILGIKVDKTTNRDTLINILRMRISSGEINVNDIKSKNIFLQNKLERVKKPETIAYIASKLLGSKIERFTSEDLVKLGLEKVESGEIEEKELLTFIESAKKETGAAMKRKIEAPTTQKIQKEVDVIRDDIRDIKKRLNNIDAERQDGFLRRYRQNTGDRIADFLKQFKMIEQRINNNTETKYDELIGEIKKRNTSLSDFFEQATLIYLLDNLCDITSTLRFSITIDDFFDVLSEEVNKTHFVTRPIIYKLKEPIKKRLEISSGEFNKYLLECRAKGWLDLIEGAPTSGKHEDWLDIEGKRYYYLEIKRKG
ncbi:MAG: hypothetical protein U9O85_03870 [Euryarchaeota archaeon]|nr:hypothetical protein [Euryarchaeota archaeon]